MDLNHWSAACKEWHASLKRLSYATQFCRFSMQLLAYGKEDYVDVGEPIREIEVVPKHIPVPEREQAPAPTPITVTPKVKEPAKHGAKIHQ